LKECEWPSVSDYAVGPVTKWEALKMKKIFSIFLNCTEDLARLFIFRTNSTYRKKTHRKARTIFTLTTFVKPRILEFQFPWPHLLGKKNQGQNLPSGQKNRK
jgi:hypothetical protein